MAISLFLAIAISPIGAVNIKIRSLIGFTAYFLFTKYILCRLGKEISAFQIFSSIVVGLFIIQLPIRVLTFTSSLISFPDFILHLLGIIFGLLFARVKSPLGWGTAALGFSIALFMFFDGYDRWIHKLNFGTFTGRVSYALPAKFEAFDQNKSVVNDEDFANKVVLLDFWNTSCGVCFQKFPQLQKFYEKHRSRSAIRILAVDIPLDDDKEGEAFKAIKDEGYSFPVVITKDAQLAEQYGIKGYPTTFVIDQQGKIVFKGSIEYAVKVAEDLIKTS